MELCKGHAEVEVAFWIKGSRGLLRILYRSVGICKGENFR